MSSNSDAPAITENRGSATVHLHGPQTPEAKYYPRGSNLHTPDGYGAVSIAGGAGSMGISVFLHDAEQADAIAEAFAAVAAKFRADPKPEPVVGPCRICGTETRYVESFAGAGKPDARALIHADAGVRLRDHNAELVPGQHGPARRVHNSFPSLTRHEAEISLPGTLHVAPSDAAAFLDNAAEQGRWDSAWGYVTHDAARGRFTIYAYEAVPDPVRPLYSASREQLDRLVAAGDADAITEDAKRRGDEF
jgi:hypothetical protein